jgi:hypothetical protein
VNPCSFFSELKLRNIYKVAVAYIVGGWALSQGIAQVFPVFDVPNLIIRLIVLLMIVGLLVALVLAWMLGIAAQGIKHTATADAMKGTARRPKHTWVYVVVIGGLVSLGLFLLGRYTAQTPRQSEAATVSLPAKSIAVIPFENLSDDEANAYFVAGMWDEILTKLAQLRDLKVVSRTSTDKFQSHPEDMCSVSSELKVADLESLATKVYIDKTEIAAIYAALGDRDRTFAALQQPAADRSGRVSAPLFDDPRFPQLEYDITHSAIVLPADEETKR